MNGNINKVSNTFKRFNKQLHLKNIVCINK